MSSGPSPFISGSDAVASSLSCLGPALLRPGIDLILLRPRDGPLTGASFLIQRSRLVPRRCAEISPPARPQIPRRRTPAPSRMNVIRESARSPDIFIPTRHERQLSRKYLGFIRLGDTPSSPESAFRRTAAATNSLAPSMRARRRGGAPATCSLRSSLHPVPVARPPAPLRSGARGPAFREASALIVSASPRDFARRFPGCGPGPGRLPIATVTPAPLRPQSPSGARPPAPWRAVMTRGRPRRHRPDKQP